MQLNDIKTTFYGLSKLGIKKVYLEKASYKDLIDYVYLHSDVGGDPIFSNTIKNNYPFYLFGVEVCQQLHGANSKAL